MQPTTRSRAPSRPPLARRSQQKMIAGVASGLGDHFHVEPTLVRLAFVVLTLAGGAGAILYAGGWLFLPTQSEPGRPRDRSRSDVVQVVALGVITLGVLLLARSLGLGFGNALLWPVVLAAIGTALIVGRSGKPIDELIGELVRRERGLPATTDAAETSSVLRVVLGGALVVAGIALVRLDELRAGYLAQSNSAHASSGVAVCASEEMPITVDSMNGA